MAAAASSNDRSELYDRDLLLQDPWDRQFSLVDAPCPQQLADRNCNGDDEQDDEDEDAESLMPAGGQNVHDWTLDAMSPASPQEILDASLKMLFRSPEKIVDVRRIISHLAEADALLHQGESAGGIDAGHERWQPLNLHPRQMPQARQPAVQQRRQQQPYQNQAYLPPRPNRGLEHLKKENEELKAVNKQWHEFWSSQKTRHEKLNDERDRQLAELKNQLAQARTAQRTPPLPPPPPPQPQDPTESLIADTTEAMHRLERDRVRLTDELARANRELEGVRQENEVLQAQVALYREDFDRERADRESAQARLAELREQLNPAQAAPAAAPAAPPAAAAAAAAAPPAPPSPADRRAFLQQRQMQQQQQLLASAVGGANHPNNSNNNRNSAIYDHMPDSRAGGGHGTPAAPWKCAACTLENPATARHCTVCDKAKPQLAENPYLP